jgi:glutamate synthase (ferredoxin)
VVLILGGTGSNVGAGMTGGECYVLDETSAILARVNSQLVEAHRPDGAQLSRLKTLVARHVELTGSVRGAALLEDWDRANEALWRIAPRGELARIETVHEGSVGAPV